MATVPNLTRTLLPLPMILFMGCAVLEPNRPPAPTPTGWVHYSQGLLSFDRPSEWTMATRPTSDNSLDIFFTSMSTGQERCVLAIHFGIEFYFPTMPSIKPFAKQAFNTRISGARTKRINAPESELPGTSEGLIELGGTGPFRRAHFRYAHLEGTTRQAAEQVIASIRNKASK